MTLRNMADQQVYQNLNQKSKTGKQNKIKTTEGKWKIYSPSYTTNTCNIFFFLVSDHFPSVVLILFCLPVFDF
jgi:hypothetical protein